MVVDGEEVGVFHRHPSDAPTPILTKMSDKAISAPTPRWYEANPDGVRPPTPLPAPDNGSLTDHSTSLDKLEKVINIPDSISKLTVIRKLNKTFKHVTEVLRIDNGGVHRTRTDRTRVRVR